MKFIKDDGPTVAVVKFGVETSDRVRRPVVHLVFAKNCNAPSHAERTTHTAVQYTTTCTKTLLPIQTRVIVHRTSLLVRTRWYNPRTMFVASMILMRKRHHLLPLMFQTV